jgi:hypothetical protein
VCPFNFYFGLALFARHVAQCRLHIGQRERLEERRVRPEIDDGAGRKHGGAIRFEVVERRNGRLCESERLHGRAPKIVELLFGPFALFVLAHGRCVVELHLQRGDLAL